MYRPVSFYLEPAHCSQVHVANFVESAFDLHLHVYKKQVLKRNITFGPKNGVSSVLSQPVDHTSWLMGTARDLCLQGYNMKQAYYVNVWTSFNYIRLQIVLF